MNETYIMNHPILFIMYIIWTFFIVAGYIVILISAHPSEAYLRKLKRDREKEKKEDEEMSRMHAIWEKEKEQMSEKERRERNVAIAYARWYPWDKKT